MIKTVIVEDDPMVLEINKNFIMEVEGFEIIAALKSGGELLNYLKTHSPELLILDIYLPDIDGLTLLKEIRRQNISVDVLAITAAQQGEIVAELLRYGVVDYIIKPFKKERLVKALLTYKNKYLKIGRKVNVQQEDIDRLFTRSSAGGELPKGLNEITLKKVLSLLKESREPLAAAEVAKRAGISRVTARRYLEYLEREGIAGKEIRYGSIGRPVNYYYLL
ncbi:two-component system response regulator [Carboxydothermus islandicus]|uniref:Transcriptional regulatory protein n=1 Tax=Carboxydothermus islandicus TaxID=661089 RepID=A0A1L8D3W1_9THEO|nr:response regulator [Carboxydothermus islandicus]GAV25849.1 two-component system response regulator [Carboxydothermus islandicus]